MSILLFSPFIIQIIIWIVVWVVIGSIFGFATNAIIRNKGYQENWFWWGFFFGLIAMLVALSKPEKVEPQRTQIDSGGNAGGQAGGQGQSTYQNSANILNTVAGDALSEKDSRAKNDGEGDVDILRIPIAQYNHASRLKPRDLTCKPYRGQYAFAIKLSSFWERNISAVMTDIILHTTLGGIYAVKDIGFMNFQREDSCIISGMTQYPLPKAQFIMIEKADIIIKKYVEDGRTIELSEEEIRLSPLEEELRKADIREKLIREAEKMESAEQIYEYLLKYNKDNEMADELLMGLVKDQVFIEHMCGIRKEACIEKMKTYFEEGGI